MGKIKIYACGECGYRFKPGLKDQLWIMMGTGFMTDIKRTGSLNMTCPGCKKKTYCSPSYDQKSEIQNIKGRNWQKSE